jgi:preprotein translocase subunit SecB
MMEKRYNELIKDIELSDIYLGSVQFKRHAFPDPDTYTDVRASLTTGKSTYKSSEGELFIQQQFQFLLEEVSDDRKKSRKLFELKGTYCLLYQSAQTIDDEIFELFKNRNIPINLHPYTRELIHNSMARAGLPPFILPALKIKRFTSSEGK